MLVRPERILKGTYEQEALTSICVDVAPVDHILFALHLSFPFELRIVVWPWRTRDAEFVADFAGVVPAHHEIGVGFAIGAVESSGPGIDMASRAEGGGRNGFGLSDLGFLRHGAVAPLA